MLTTDTVNITSTPTVMEYRKFDCNGAENYHKMLQQQEVIKDETLLKRFEILNISHRVLNNNKIKASGIDIMKALFLKELSVFYQDRIAIERFAKLFEGQYVTNDKSLMYAYELEFYTKCAREGMEVNFYVLPDAIRLHTEMDFLLYQSKHQYTESNIVINFNKIVSKTLHKPYNPRYLKVALSHKSLQVVSKLLGKSQIPNVRKKSLLIDYNAAEEVKGVTVIETAPVQKYREVEKQQTY